MFKLYYLLLLLTVSNCNTAKGIDKKETSKPETEVQTITAKEMIEKGFSKGTITVSKSKDCPYILTVEQYKDKLDPINLGDFFKDSDIPGLVWIKFASLRMPSRCNEARPVSITKIDKRKD